MNIINVMNIKGSKAIYSSLKYPITDDTIIELKGEFRSAGKEKSKIYFGLQCFRGNGSEIKAYDINRVNEPLIISSINTDYKSFSIIKKPENWNNSGEDNTYDNRNKKYLGFYFDGNTNHLADYIMISPAYKPYTDNKIYLNNEIPKKIIEKIVPYKTVVMNQQDGMTWDYSAACGVEVPEKWTKYEAEYNGFNEGYGDIAGKFRLETNSVSPFINCIQKKEDVLEVRNVEIVIKNIKFN